MGFLRLLMGFVGTILPHPGLQGHIGAGFHPMAGGRLQVVLVLRRYSLVPIGTLLGLCRDSVGPY